MHPRMIGAVCASALVMSAFGVAPAQAAQNKTDPRRDALAAVDLVGGTWVVPGDGLLRGTIKVRDVTSKTVVKFWYHDKAYFTDAVFTVARKDGTTRVVTFVDGEKEKCGSAAAGWRPRKNLVTLTVSRKCWSWNGAAYDSGRTSGGARTYSRGDAAAQDRLGTAHFDNWTG